MSICSVRGLAITTVEGLGSVRTRIHPVQERLAKCHGTQCGFCSPGMVMSIYTLLRNHPEPSEDQVMEALGGNLCRCTGYRPIVESGKTFCKVSRYGTSQSGPVREKPTGILTVCTKMYDETEFRPFDPSQEPIFPPQLIRMAEDEEKRTLVFHGERITWISPATLKDLLELREKHPEAPLVMGNTSVGPQMKFQGVFHPVIISPVWIPQLNVVTVSERGVTLGAGHSLTQVKEILASVVSEQPKEKTKTFRALLKHLRTLAGPPVRNLATLGGHVVSRPNFSDLNPILAAGGALLHLISQGGERQLPLDGPFLSRSPSADLEPGEIVVSVHIPFSTKWEFVVGLRQAQRHENASAIVNLGLRVLFGKGTDTIKDLKLFYGNVGPSVLAAPQSCHQLLGRRWDDEMLNEACKLVLDEIYIPPTAKDGMVNYKRTLIVSFLFKSYLRVLRGLSRLFPDIAENFQSALDDFPLRVPEGLQMYQCVDPQKAPQDPIGHPVMHQSGLKHATGEAIFSDDIPVGDRELALALVTSSRAHARITSIDVSEALGMPGVVTVVTAQDVPGKNGSEDERFLAQEEVICVGQIVCAVAADSSAHAKRAAEKVKIEYEDLKPLIITIKDALKHSSFLTDEKKIEKGDVEKGFQQVDQITEGEIHVEGQEHFYMETQTVLAIPKEEEEMEIHVGSQYPEYVQDRVAEVLGVSKSRIFCHMRRTGGGFGGKVTKPALLGAVVAVAANKTGRPVRLVLERGDDMLITAGRHPLFAKYKVRIIIIARRSDGGFGFPQGTLVVESYITAVAAKCDLTPEQVREINMYKTVSRTAYQQTFNPEALRKCWKECLEKSSFSGRRKATEEFNERNYWKKKGIAIVPMKFTIGLPTGYFHQASALVHIYSDGSVLVAHGGCEMGQGLHTKMIQNACQILMERLEPIIQKNPNGKWKEWAQKAIEESISLSATGYFKGYQTNMDWEKEEGNAFPYYVYGAAASEVEIDCLTGAHKTLRTDIFIDAAFSINPAIDAGQVEGAFIQGRGLYTTEELKYSPEGVLLSRGPEDYKIPSVPEIPEKFYVSLVKSRNPIAIYSSKGLGEAGMFLGSSVFFAITDAVAAARRDRGLTAAFTLSSPATPELIRMTCADGFTDMVGLGGQSPGLGVTGRGF
uniref:FAD-binding PCMH-type domain-containing protein n=1 Tax=Ornithorhynchus anatinus TaxID=9258 RepID=A0A6I8N722_ORNAN